MNAIQQAAVLDFMAVGINCDVEGKNVSVIVNKIKFDFYSGKKVFNLGVLKKYRESDENALVPGSNWAFACFPRVTNLLNANKFIGWIDEDNNITFSDHDGNAILSFGTAPHEEHHLTMEICNERRVLAKGWESWTPTGVYSV